MRVTVWVVEPVKLVCPATRSARNSQYRFMFVVGLIVPTLTGLVVRGTLGADPYAMPGEVAYCVAPTFMMVVAPLIQFVPDTDRAPWAVPVLSITSVC